MNNLISKVFKIIDNTIGSELTSVTPSEKITNDDITFNGSKPDMTKPKHIWPKIDENKQLILTPIERNIIYNHNIKDEDIKNGNIKIGLADTDDNIIIVRTSDSSWACLAGREWHLDRKTLDWHLASMN